MDFALFSCDEVQQIWFNQTCENSCLGYENQGFNWLLFGSSILAELAIKSTFFKKSKQFQVVKMGYWLEIRALALDF